MEFNCLGCDYHLLASSCGAISFSKAFLSTSRFWLWKRKHSTPGDGRFSRTPRSHTDMERKKKGKLSTSFAIHSHAILLLQECMIARWQREGDAQKGPKEPQSSSRLSIIIITIWPIVLAGKFPMRLDCRTKAKYVTIKKTVPGIVSPTHEEIYVAMHEKAKIYANFLQAVACVHGMSLRDLERP